MKLSRDKIQRMIDVGSGGSSGGVSGSELAGMLAGYATEGWVNDHYISIDFFSRLFQAHGTENGQTTDIDPNDMDSTITSVESMFGFWTELYLSAMGNNSGGSAGLSLDNLTDVTITGTPTNGQVLTFDAATGKWVNGTATGASTLAGLTDVTLTTVTDNQVLIYNSTTSKWVNSDIKTVNGYSILGTGDIQVGGGAGAYLPLYGGGTITNGFVRLINCDYRCFSAFKSDGSNGTYGQIFNLGSASSAGIGNEMGILSLFNNQNEVIRLYGDYNADSFINSRRIGIGTTSPIEKLYVVGNIAIGSPGSTAYIGVPYDASNTSIINRIQIAGASDADGTCIHYYGGTYTSNTALNAHKFSVVFIDNAFVIKNSGWVGIGTDSPSNKLAVVGGGIHIDNTTQQVVIFQESGVNKAEVSYHSTHGVFMENLVASTGFCIKNNGNTIIGTSINTASYKLHVEGSIYATGAITALSDMRDKTVAENITDMNLEKIANAPVFTYYWKDKKADDDLHIGSSAQYWKTVLPEAVLQAKDEKGTLSMQYGVAALVSAIITARKVVDHERRIVELEKENQRLKTEVEQLRLLN